MARLVRQVHATQTYTRIHRRRMESGRHMQTCMQAYRTERKTLFYRVLFHFFSNASRRLSISGSCLKPTTERRQLPASIAG